MTPQALATQEKTSEEYILYLKSILDGNEGYPDEEDVLLASALAVDLNALDFGNE